MAEPQQLTQYELSQQHPMTGLYLRTCGLKNVWVWVTRVAVRSDGIYQIFYTYLDSYKVENYEVGGGNGFCDKLPPDNIECSVRNRYGIKMFDCTATYHLKF